MIYDCPAVGEPSDSRAWKIKGCVCVEGVVVVGWGRGAASTIAAKRNAGPVLAKREGRLNSNAGKNGITTSNVRR